MKISHLAAAISVVLLAPTGVAQNLLTNPSFEAGGLAGWTFFGNATPEAAAAPAVVPRTGTSVAKVFGSFTGGFNVSGIFQSFPALPGQTFTLDCWSRHWSGDPLTGLGLPNGNWAVMKLAFFDAAHVEIGNAEQIILDGTFNTDTWIDNPPVTGSAPPNTVTVEALILFLQPGMVGGAMQVDDVELLGPPASAAYPGTGEDLLLSSAVNGSFATAGPGNDIKTCPGGGLLEFKVSSPSGTFNLTGYYLVGSLFTTGVPPVPQPPFPELWFDLSSFFILVSGLPTPIGPPLIGQNGASTYYTTPTFLPGLSLMIQALVIHPTVGNGLYAASDAHEIRLQ